MKTTIELPDDLFRRAKATAALRGIKLRELIEEGLLRVLDNSDGSVPKAKPQTAFDVMEFACGIGSSDVTDLATNPRHMDGFGRD